MFIALVLLAQAAAAANVPLFRGVNIHFTQQQPGELAMLAKGFQGVRMDFSWAAVEPQAGQYDFSAYDRLVSDLSQAQLFPYFILDYANPLYDGGAPPQSDGAIAAFVAFARAALGRYAGQGIVWEMWNEPNGDNFWPPKHNATAYARLALAVGTMFKVRVSNRCQRPRCLPTGSHAVCVPERGAGRPDHLRVRLGLHHDHLPGRRAALL